MSDPIEIRLLDKRVAHRYLRKGLVDEKEYERIQKALPDLADHALPVEASMEGDDLDDLEDEEPGDEGPAKT